MLVYRDIARALGSNKCSLTQPVCTTEIGRLALKYKELEKKGVKLATISADPVSWPALTVLTLLNKGTVVRRRKLVYNTNIL